MLKHPKTPRIRSSHAYGKGIINKAINNLPFEIHLPGYQFCGPGTKLIKRLARGDTGINLLDAACKQHDIAYSKTNNQVERNKADLELAEKAWQRAKAKDSSLGERINAFLVTNTMKAKAKFGMGLKIRKKQNNKKKDSLLLSNIIANSRSAVKSKKPKSYISAIKTALAAAKKNVKLKQVRLPASRIIPIPKIGGLLPLLPIFAALSAIGSISGGAAGIAKAINDAKAAKSRLIENQRHNQKMETIAMGKGLFLKPYKKGLGLYLNPKN